MTQGKPLAGIGFALAVAASVATAQPPTVEQLQNQIQRLQSELATQRADFETKIGALKDQVDSSLRQELEAQIDDIVAKKSKFYRRPEERGRTTSDKSLFEAL